MFVFDFSSCQGYSREAGMLEPSSVLPRKPPGRPEGEEAVEGREEDGFGELRDGTVG